MLERRHEYIYMTVLVWLPFLYLKHFIKNHHVVLKHIHAILKFALAIIDLLFGMVLFMELIFSCLQLWCSIEETGFDEGCSGNTGGVLETGTNALGNVARVSSTCYWQRHGMKFRVGYQ